MAADEVAKDAEAANSADESKERWQERTAIAKLAQGAVPH